MSLSANKGRLTGSVRELSLQWEHTKDFWRDHKSAEFEKKYLDELFVFTNKTVVVLEKLDELLKKIRSDCE
ncbi:MAG TPA: hypothetical protein VH280_08545 [Verrucomicrobiae bacterium]|jgi:hypothetical protein|nr:hypothetical protein [Verrucomicrobiae bacterium]